MATRSFSSLTLVVAIAAALAAATAHAQVNGNSTISAPALGSTLSISTSTQYAGAISSLKWNGKEFVNNWDHGRQIQTHFQAFNRYECYNPYEGGRKDDGQGPTTSSKLLSLNASGNVLDSDVQMSWYLPTRDPRPGAGDNCGNPAYFLPCPPYTGPLSDYKMHKHVTIGFAGLPNVVEYLTDVYIPERILRGLNQTGIAALYDFSNIWTYDVVSRGYRKIRSLGG
jgi:hypothetical protein